jgi:hypothetical protein
MPDAVTLAVKVIFCKLQTNNLVKNVYNSCFLFKNVYLKHHAICIR